MSAIEWGRLKSDLTEEIVSAVGEVTMQCAASSVYGAALTDIHARNMLLLWPTIRVACDEPDYAVADRVWDIDSWPVQLDGSRRGDMWAEILTTSVGLGDNRWNTVIERFRESLVIAARGATRALIDSGVVDRTFAVVVHDPEDPVAALKNSLTAEQLAMLFPELYQLSEVEVQLSRLPETERTEQLVEMLAGIDGGAERTLAQRLLVSIGWAAVPRVVDALEDPVATDEVIERFVEVLVAIREVDEQAAGRILAFAGRPTTTLNARARAISALCMLGYTTKAVQLLADVPDDLAGRALSAPYVDGERRWHLDYEPIREVLAERPELDEVMAAALTPDRIQYIGCEDLRTAADALVSPSHFIRRHASIVLLSSHL